MAFFIDEHCEKGYKYSPANDVHNCVDIDECNEDGLFYGSLRSAVTLLHCTNTIGNYNYTGFIKFHMHFVLKIFWFN